MEKEKEKSLSKPLAVQAPEDDLVGLEEILQAAADFAVDKITSIEWAQSERHLEGQ